MSAISDFRVVFGILVILRNIRAVEPCSLAEVNEISSFKMSYEQLEEKHIKESDYCQSLW